jgi:uncharacterized protein (UPF0335 family)
VNSSGMRGAYEVRLFRKVTHVLSLDSNCSTLHRVEKSVKEIENEMKCVLNELKSWGYLYVGGE